jgi:hypothetical protein
MFIGSSFKDPDLALNRQETVNWYIESQPEGARNQKVLIGAPGTVEWTTVGSGPIKAIYNHNERLYCVSDVEFYEILSDGSSILRGTLGESSQPFIVANLTQVVIVNGVSGYVWDETTDTFTQISDPNFFPTNYGTYQDGYLFFVREGTGQFFVSDIDDALTYPAINFDEAVLRGDVLLSVVSDTRSVWLVGARTIEPWYNNGQLTGVPVVPNRGAASLRGTAAYRSVVSSQLGVFFLGDDFNVYWMQGYTPKNVSSDAQAKTFTEYAQNGGVDNAYAFMMNMDGHWFYVLTFPTQGKTFVYDPEEGAWHNRESWQLGYWRASCYESCFGLNLVGDSETNKIGSLRRDVYQEYGGYWVARRVSGVYSAKQRQVHANRLELVFPSGQVPQNVTHQASLRYSDNKGLSFGNPRIMTIGRAGAGNIRAIWWSMGSFRDRVYELSVSTNGNRDLLEEDADFEIGGY